MKARAWPSVGAVLGALRGSGAIARSSALSAALAIASPEEAESIAPELLELAADAPSPGAGRASRARRSASDTALASLLTGWERLPRQVRLALPAVGDGRWGALGPHLEYADDPSALQGLARAIDRLDARPLAPVLVRALSAGEEPAAYAERALVRLAARVARESAEARTDASLDPRDLHLAPVARGVRQALAALATHKRRGVALAAVLLLPGRGRTFAVDGEGAAALADLASLVGERDHPAGVAFRGALRNASESRVRGRAWVLLSEAPFAVAALDRLRHASSLEEHEALLTRHHLALHPARPARLASVRITPAKAASSRLGGDPRSPGPGSALPASEELEKLSVPARRGLARLVAVFDPAPSVRDALLGPLLGDADPAVRLWGVGAVGAHELEDYVFDADASVARRACLRWSVAGEGGVLGAGASSRRAAIAGRLMRSAHASVRTLASQELARHDEHRAHEPASRALARRRLASDPDGTLARWRAAIEQGARGDAEAERFAIRVLGTVRAIGAAEKLGACLIGVAPGVAPGERPRLAATLASALAEAPGGAAAEILKAWLAPEAAGDARVRANALEALARRRRLLGENAGDGAGARAWRERLMEWRTDGAHRVRASAVRELLRGEAAGEMGVYEAKPGELLEGSIVQGAVVGSLCSMLEDDRAAHRLAGVWAAERAVVGGGRERLGPSLSELAGRLHGLAERDADPRIRARAGRCAAIAGEAVRTGWGERGEG
ncbi:MAG: hypothetical protein EA378_00445 [Phycisphaerales bacterium]|nr:MAG: hypothetical protein EA378_00445 [Phycisphaerales bacterium]